MLFSTVSTFLFLFLPKSVSALPFLGYFVILAVIIALGDAVKGLIKALGKAVMFLVNLVVDMIINFLNLLLAPVVRALLNMMEGMIAYTPTIFPFAGASNAATTNLIKTMLQILVPIYVLLILLVGMYIIMVSQMPWERAKAKAAFRKLIMSMFLVSSSPPIFQMLLNISHYLTTETFETVNPAMQEAMAKGIVVAFLSPITLFFAIAIMLFAMIFVLFRIIAIQVFAILFPVALFLYFFDFTKGFGANLLRMTMLWIFLQVIQAIVFVMTASLAFEQDHELMRGFIVLAGMFGIIGTGLMMSGLMKWVGGAVAGMGAAVAGAGATPGMRMAGSAATGAGQLMMGGGPTALVTAGATAGYFAPGSTREGAHEGGSRLSSMMRGAAKTFTPLASWRHPIKPISQAVSAVKGGAQAFDRQAAGPLPSSGQLIKDSVASAGGKGGTGAGDGEEGPPADPYSQQVEPFGTGSRYSTISDTGGYYQSTEGGIAGLPALMFQQQAARERRGASLMAAAQDDLKDGKKLAAAGKFMQGLASYGMSIFVPISPLWPVREVGRTIAGITPLLLPDWKVIPWVGKGGLRFVGLRAPFYKVGQLAGLGFRQTSARAYAKRRARGHARKYEAAKSAGKEKEMIKHRDAIVDILHTQMYGVTREGTGVLAEADPEAAQLLLTDLEKQYNRESGGLYEEVMQNMDSNYGASIGGLDESKELVKREGDGALDITQNPRAGKSVLGITEDAGHEKVGRTIAEQHGIVEDKESRVVRNQLPGVSVDDKSGGGLLRKIDKKIGQGKTSDEIWESLDKDEREWMTQKSSGTDKPEESAISSIRAQEMRKRVTDNVGRLIGEDKSDEDVWAALENSDKQWVTGIAGDENHALESIKNERKRINMNNETKKEQDAWVGKHVNFKTGRVKSFIGLTDEESAAAVTLWTEEQPGGESRARLHLERTPGGYYLPSNDYKWLREKMEHSGGRAHSFEGSKYMMITGGTGKREMYAMAEYDDGKGNSLYRGADGNMYTSDRLHKRAEERGGQVDESSYAILYDASGKKEVYEQTGWDANGKLTYISSDATVRRNEDELEQYANEKGMQIQHDGGANTRIVGAGIAPETYRVQADDKGNVVYQGEDGNSYTKEEIDARAARLGEVQKSGGFMQEEDIKGMLGRGMTAKNINDTAAKFADYRSKRIEAGEGDTASHNLRLYYDPTSSNPVATDVTDKTLWLNMGADALQGEDRWAADVSRPTQMFGTSKDGLDKMCKYPDRLIAEIGKSDEFKELAKRIEHAKKAVYDEDRGTIRIVGVDADGDDKKITTLFVKEEGGQLNVYSPDEQMERIRAHEQALGQDLWTGGGFDKLSENEQLRMRAYVERKVGQMKSWDEMGIAERAKWKKKYGGSASEVYTDIRKDATARLGEDPSEGANPYASLSKSEKKKLVGKELVGLKSDKRIKRIISHMARPVDKHIARRFRVRDRAQTKYNQSQGGGLTNDEVEHYYNLLEESGATEHEVAKSYNTQATGGVVDTDNVFEMMPHEEGHNALCHGFWRSNAESPRTQADVDHALMNDGYGKLSEHRYFSNLDDVMKNAKPHLRKARLKGMAKRDRHRGDFMSEVLATKYGVTVAERGGTGARDAHINSFVEGGLKKGFDEIETVSQGVGMDKIPESYVSRMAYYKTVTDEMLKTEDLQQDVRENLEGLKTRIDGFEDGLKNSRYANAYTKMCEAGKELWRAEVRPVKIVPPETEENAR